MGNTLDVIGGIVMGTGILGLITGFADSLLGTVLVLGGALLLGVAAMLPVIEAA